MSLCLAASEERECPCSAVSCIECGCELEKIAVVRAYVEGHFPDRAAREFHSRSTVKQGGVAVPCADYHVLSISGGGPCCAVLTREFLEQPVEGLGERLRGWDLATALRVESMVIVGKDGLSPL
jgi:hypothetical protein